MGQALKRLWRNLKTSFQKTRKCSRSGIIYSVSPDARSYLLPSARGYLLDTALLQLINRSAKKYLKRDMTVLDIGCGNKPYKPIFSGKNIDYMGIDIRKDGCADIICDVKQLPFTEASFSLCLCFQVLEHVDDSSTAIKEILRVLCPHGLLFISVPSSWIIHGAPHDYWRWTSYGVKKLLSDFHVVELYRCRGSVGSMIQCFELFIPRKMTALIILFNKLGEVLDGSVWLERHLPQFDISYFAVAVKG